MTDRHSAYVVVLDHDIREDDAEAVITALRMTRGVVDVRPVVAEFDTEIITSLRLKAQLSTSLLEWMREHLA